MAAATFVVVKGKMQRSLFFFSINCEAEAQKKENYTQEILEKEVLTYSAWRQLEIKEGRDEDKAPWRAAWALLAKALAHWFAPLIAYLD